MDEKNELSLEDILKEFGAFAGEGDSEDPTLEEAKGQMPIAQEPPLEERLKALLGPNDEDVKEYIPQTERPDPAMKGQTVRIDPEQLRSAMGEAKPTDAQTIRFGALDESSPAMQGGTVRFEPLSGKKETEVPLGGTIRFDPVDEPDQTPPPADEPVPEGAEPFSASWEPEYDAPMGEYVPPEPIVFMPRSRLRELKRKLVAGPERRYYALAEQGLGKLQAAIFLSILVVILSFVAIGMHSMGLVQDERMRLLVFGELFAMMLSALLGSGRLLDGIASAFKGRFTPDTMLALSFLVCMGDGVFCLKEVRVPFCAAFCLEVTMSLWAEYQRRNTEMGQMDTLRRATRLNRVAKADNCFEGRPGFFVEQGEVDDFMTTYNAPTTPERLLGWYCLISFLGTGAIALAAGLFQGVSVGLQTWSAAILAAIPVTTFVCQTRPMAVLERRLHKLGVVLCGWQGVKAMSGAAAVPLADTDLFPAGSMKINGVKFYSRRDPDQILAYATAILECTNNALTPLFVQLLDSRNGHHYEADSYRSYDGGVGGEVRGESVLLGSASFLQDMGVEMPEGTRVNQAVYVAVDGELGGVFALAFGKLKGVSAGLGTLCGYRGLTPVLTSDNFLLNESFLRGKFSVNTRRVAFPNQEQRQALAQWSPAPGESLSCALTTQDGLAPAAFAITGARALRTSCNLGLVVHMLAGMVGMLMVLVLTLVDAQDLLTPANLLLFHLIWCVPGLLISSWTRHL